MIKGSDLFYIDRKTGEKKRELIYGERALFLYYGDSFWSKALFYLILPWVVSFSFCSKLYGMIQKTRWSQKKIAPFIQKYQVDSSEFLEKKFFSFNDFFIRKLKEGARPIGASSLIAPADGRYLAFPKISLAEKFFVKGKVFDLVSFLKNATLAEKFREGSLLIVRLAPPDYHRFHFPCDGTVEEIYPMKGPLYSVSPIALRKKGSIFLENKRMITLIHSPLFGKIAYVEVGATFVGTIHQTSSSLGFVKKGDEKGYFSFGGSCLVLLFEKGKVVFDEDLVDHSKEGIETKILFGSSLGSQGSYL